ncbi:MAG TPA: ATP-binding protein, partial [Burkholderiaceae bacterium]|nr:ATP-binding protein [Burkholderiaceae bacterium]
MRQALEPALLHLFDHAAQLEVSGATDVLPAYREQVSALRDVARQHHMSGVDYVGMLLDDGLARLAAQHRALTADERAALADWPVLLMAELFRVTPEAEPGAWAVLHSMRRHAWFPELPDYFWHVIEDRLSEDARALETDAMGLDDAPYGETPALPHGALEPSPDGGAHDPDDRDDPGDDADDDVGDDANDVYACSVPPDDAPPDTTHEDGTHEDGVDVDVDVDVDDEADEGFAATQPAPAPGGGVASREELAALREAVAALHADGAALLDERVAPAGRDEAFEAYTEQLGNLVGAASVVGLGGFQEVLELVLSNTSALRLSGEPMNEAQRRLLMRWPPLAMAYLAAPGDAAGAWALAELAGDAAWPCPAHPNDVYGWLQAMSGLQVVDARATPARAGIARPEDVDLQVPSDIESNVLDSLLRELPQQAHDFSVLVQQLGQGGTLDQLEHARRVAHTLKGAGNTVGVKGVANLTHALEDILAACGRERRLPPPALAETLMEAADCLEAMSEALLAGQACLPESLAVHQKVLDWANRIDREGLPADAPPGLEMLPLPAVPDHPVLPNDVVPSHGEVLSRDALAPYDTVQPQGAQPAAAEVPADEADPLLRVPASLIDSLLKLVGENAILSSQIQDHVAKLGHELGALRSDSRQFSKLSYELEQLVDVRGGAMLSGRQGQFDALEMDQYNELHMLSRRIVESDADSREFTRAFEREVNGLRDLLAEKDRVQLEIQRKILRARMVEVGSIAPRLQRSVRQTARVLGRAVRLDLQGTGTLVDGQLLQRLLDPLMHLLRNAVDHGIEPAAERLAAGKPEAGTITLCFAAQGANLLVSCRDDGRGLDLDAIRAKAQRAGLLAPAAVLTEDQAVRLILLPGFSTRERATQISGRGVGLDVVHRTVVDLRGTLEIRPQPGHGAHFDMVFPVQLSSTQVMITRSPRHMLAISVRGVDQILPVGRELEVEPGGRMTYRLPGAPFDPPLQAQRLEVLLGLPTHAFAQPGAMEVVMIVRDDNRLRHAVVVPEFRDSRNVVVKPLNPIIPRELGVDGATILGDGSVAMVLDLPDLLRGQAAAGMPLARIPQAAPA